MRPFLIYFCVSHILVHCFCTKHNAKIFALGGKYFGDGWNLMDGGIVITTITFDVLQELAVGGSGFSSLRALRALRALRLLRVIPRAPGLRRVVNTMIRGLPSVMNVTVVVLVFFLILRFVCRHSL